MNSNQMLQTDRAFHDWYRFVLSFPPHSVRTYLSEFGNGRLLDPFCGTGTALVEAKRSGTESVGVDASSFAAFVSRTKTDWQQFDSDDLRHAAQQVALCADDLRGPLLSLPIESDRLLIACSISPIPLHRSLMILRGIDRVNADYRELLRLALAKGLAGEISNLSHGPEVCVKSIKEDAPVAQIFLSNVERMICDLSALSDSQRQTPSVVYRADARDLRPLLRRRSIHSVITSPPYPNEKDYTRSTRLESVLLGIYTDLEGLRLEKRRLLRSNTRGVYVKDRDDECVSENQTVQKLAQEIEERRIAQNRTSGFERSYARVVRLYFGGIQNHLAALRPALANGANLVYLVGDQASFLQVPIATGRILAEIADGLGYRVERIDLFRTRRSTATGTDLREEAVVLSWDEDR